MTRYLLDTNVVSEMSRPRPSRAVVASLRRIPLDAMFLSDVAIAEIRFGTEHISHPARRDMLVNWLKNDVRARFVGRILPVTEDIFVRWLWITHLGRRKGYTFEQSDALVAATAIHHGLIVLTRDIKPFEAAEVAALDPWRQPQ